MRSVMIGLVVVLLVSTAWGQEELDLKGQDITDEVLAEKVKGLTDLEVLRLHDTKVTDEGVKKLQTAIPICTISRSIQVHPPK